MIRNKIERAGAVLCGYLKITIVTPSVTNRYPKYATPPVGRGGYWGIIYNHSVRSGGAARRNSHRGVVK